MTVEVKTIACSKSFETGKDVFTFEWRYPRPIHAEIMTHRVFGRGASSSRAIPMVRMHASIRQDPALPHKYTMNQPGMQGFEEAPLEVQEAAERLIALHREQSIQCAEDLAALGLHKQVCNRYTEPHQHIRVVVTSSQWKNFLRLRNHEMAEPTFHELARLTGEQIENANFLILERNEWHLPYFDEEEFLDGIHGMSLNDMKDLVPEPLHDVLPPYSGGRAIGQIMRVGISAARCARTSYNNFEGKRSTIQEDLALAFGKLWSFPLHASPFEHQCLPDWRIGFSKWANPHLHGNLIGFRQARKFLPDENGDKDF